MRKGVEKLIEKYDSDIDKEFIEYLIDSEDKTLKELKRFDTYYCVNNNKEDNGVLVSTIKKYDNDLFIGGWHRYEKDYLMDNDTLRDEIINYSKTHTVEDTRFLMALTQLRIRDNLSKKVYNEAKFFYYDYLDDLEQKEALYNYIYDFWIFPQSAYYRDFKLGVLESLIAYFIGMGIKNLHLLGDKYFADLPLKRGTLKRLFIENPNFYTVNNNKLPGWCKDNLDIIFNDNEIRKYLIRKNEYLNFVADIYETWESESYDKELYRCMQEAAKGHDFSIISTGYKTEIDLSHLGVFVKNKKYKELRNNPNHYSSVLSGQCLSDSLDLWFTMDGNCLMNIRDKWIPANIKTIYRRQGENPLLMKFLTIYMEHNNLYFLKDVLSDFDKGLNLSTITFEDAVKYHNRKEYVLNKYKNLTDLKINYNKADINMCYLFNKAVGYIPDREKGKLAELINSDFIYKYYKKCFWKIYNHRSKKNYARFFFEAYFIEYKNYNIDWTDDWDILLEDALSMLIDNKEQISLHYSLNRLAELHNDRMEKSRLKSMPKLNVPKKSRFNKLRNILPADFEWIKTKQRLYEESRIQHHCVWTYTDVINDDTSAIYSYVLDEDGTPTRYTIEFIYDKGKYRIRQMQKAYDRGGNEKLRAYINELLVG